jgi:hypothetical protein
MHLYETFMKRYKNVQLFLVVSIDFNVQSITISVLHVIRILLLYSILKYQKKPNHFDILYYFKLFTNTSNKLRIALTHFSILYLSSSLTVTNVYL